MPTYTVSTAFKGIDGISGVFTKASKKASMFGSIVKGNLVSGAISKGIGIAAQGVRVATTEFIAFDDAITAASAKFQDLTPDTLEALKLEARKVGAETKFSATEAGQGLDFLAMAGFNAQQSMKILAPTAKLATVANVDLARSTDIASDALGAFGLMTKDSTKLQKNFIMMNDSMAATMTRSNTGIEDMFESIKKGAPAFTAAGQSMNTFNSLVGIMANSGIKGSESGTALRNVMLRLAGPTGEASKVLTRLGIKTQDQSGNFRDIVDILADFETGLKGMGTAQRTAALSTVFGARSVTGINILLQEGTENIRKFREGLINSGGAANEMAAIMERSLGNRLKALRSALLEVGFKMLDTFAGKGKTGIENFTNAIRGMDVQPLINTLKLLFGILKVLVKISSVAFKVGQAIGRFSGRILGKLPGLEFREPEATDPKVRATEERIEAIRRQEAAENLDKFAAPNLDKEEGRRALGGEGTINVRAEKGTEISDIENNLEGINLIDLGANF
jgi:TP901 family phage tail tape measure protein